MTLEFLVPQPHQEDTMYRHPSPSQSYSTYSFNQTPTTTQYQIDFPAGNSFQTTGTITESQQGQPPTTNPWATAGFPMSGVPSDWGTSSGGTCVVDPYQGSAAFPGSQAAVGPTGSPYSEDIDFYQGFAQTTPGVGSVNTALHRPTMRSPYHHDWMRSTSYRINPQTGKTRTKDKYRVVYSDHQRLELEKEFHYSRYITIRRKAELAVSLGLSERQVKIWFQNRRAKERKHNKKRVALEGATDQKELETSSDEKIDGRLVEIKEEKGLDRVELLDPLCRGEMTPSVESTTPEVLEIGARNQPDFSVHPPLHGTGACQLQPAHVAVSASLFHSMQPLHMK